MNTQWFNALIFSLYSHHIKNLIIKKNSDTAIKRILTDYIYDIEDVDSSANDDLKTFFSIIPPPVLYLHLLRELNYNAIRQLMMKTKDMYVNINFLAKIFRYLSINCLKIFNISNTDNYYYEIDKYYDYEISNDNVILNITGEVEEFTIPALINNIPEVILVQRCNENTDEALIVQEIISNSNNERILNLNNIDKKNYDNIKSMDDVIVFNNKKYTLEACIIMRPDNSYLTCIFHKNEKYMKDDDYIMQQDWKNDFATNNNNNIMAIYVLQDEIIASIVKSTTKTSSLTSVHD
jgi:hypothetical protein